MYVHTSIVASVKLGPEDVSLLERCPHFRGWYVQTLGPEAIREVSSFKRAFCSTGSQKGSSIDICQQTGPEGLYVRSRTLPTPQPHLHQGPRVACAGMLCTNWRRVSLLGLCKVGWSFSDWDTCG